MRNCIPLSSYTNPYKFRSHPPSILLPTIHSHSLSTTHHNHTLASLQTQTRQNAVHHPPRCSLLRPPRLRRRPRPSRLRHKLRYLHAFPRLNLLLRWLKWSHDGRLHHPRLASEFPNGWRIGGGARMELSTVWKVF